MSLTRYSYIKEGNVAYITLLEAPQGSDSARYMQDLARSPRIYWIPLRPHLIAFFIYLNLHKSK